MDTTRVTVLDEPFSIRSSAPLEYTRAVAGHVDGTLRTLRKASPSLEPFPVAVLGAMEITDQLFRAREASGAEVESAAEKIEALASRVDRALENVKDEEIGPTDARGPTGP